MASLQQLLVEEGFDRPKFSKTASHKPYRKAADDSIALPIYICHDRKTLDNTRKKQFARSTSSVYSSRHRGSDSERSRHNNNKNNNNVKSLVNYEEQEDGVKRGEEPGLDEIAIKAVISILGGYIGRYSKDAHFRELIRKKCYSCLQRNNKQDGSENGIFVKMELGIKGIESLFVQDHQGTTTAATKKELRMKTLKNSIRLLSNVASLNSNTGFTNGGTPNSYLSACAQLYLSIVFKIEKNDRISARHLLQVFCDAPFIGRTHLLPDLWEHFLLPHLLHLKIWYVKELDFLSESDYGETRQIRMKALEKLYNDEMDNGTSLFALYYKQWLKVGAQSAPPVPAVHLPSRPSYACSKRTSSDSFASRASINKNLYKMVFGPNFERRSSMEVDSRNEASINTWGLEEQEKVCTHEDNLYDRHSDFVQMNGERASGRSSSQIDRNPKPELLSETHKSDFSWFLTCKSDPINKKYIVRNEEKLHVPSSDLSRAISTICSSDSLEHCETAMRVISKSWLDSHGNPNIETALSKTPVIEAILEVLFASNDDEILELAISILSELVSRNEFNKQIVLNSDPQLEIFIRLLKSSSLFLKAAVVLYLLKPKAKQMISMEWVPLVLRVLEFGDQVQTLFTVRCSPQVSAFYFLDQLLTGFDEDKNLENARQVVSLGGLSLLIKRVEKGDILERINAVSAIYCCLRADKSCRNYLATNINITCIIDLFIVGSQKRSNACALGLLTELICNNRRSHRTKFLEGLRKGGCSLNTMHIFLVYLQKASPQERPLVAAILFQLDLMSLKETEYEVAAMLQGDVSKCSIYREEAMDEIIESLDTQKCTEQVQEQTARALEMLGGHFSYTGEASVEKWLLKQAGFDERSMDSFEGKDIIVDEYMHSSEEEDATQNWQRGVAVTLLTSGNRRLLEALSDSIANSIPQLAHASLVMVSWMTCFLPEICDEMIRSAACSILMPHLVECLKYDRDLEERVIASLSLLNLTKTCSECISALSEAMDKKVVALLHNLSLVTWTATQLISFDPQKIT